MNLADPIDGWLAERLQEAVAAQMARYEERWVDEPVPALGGLTPREALDDPTRREDLNALLREMRAMRPPDGAVGMSADRIERLLGISEPTPRHRASRSAREVLDDDRSE